MPSVRHRKVFFIHGFDPHPARRYRELYRSEAARQVAIAGYRLDVAANGNEWRVSARMDGKDVRSDIEVLGWSDLARRAMGSGRLSLLADLTRVLVVYLRGGAAFRLARLRPVPVLVGFYPVALLLAAMFLSAVPAIWVGGTVGVLLGVGAFLVLLQVLSWTDERHFAFYLLRDMAFASRHDGAPDPELAARVSDFAGRIAVAGQNGYDEVLVIGHSSGAEVAVGAVAEALRSCETAEFSLLTLGQAIPMVSVLPGATMLRRDLAELSRAERLTWIDVSAPADGGAFALCDPVAVSGVAGPDKRWPLVVSAAFRNTLSEARLRHLRWRFLTRHFQYLCAFDHPDSYDFFRITAGPDKLSEVFAGRRASARRIERVAA